MIFMGTAQGQQIFFEDFEGYDVDEPVAEELDEWTGHTPTGDREWYIDEFEGNHAEMTSHESQEENESWIITPEIELPEAELPIHLSFDVVTAWWTHDGLSVYVSTDFDGENVDDASWNDITGELDIPSEPDDGFGDPERVYTDLSDYQGDNINIAWAYRGNDGQDETTTYQIDNVLVEELSTVTFNADMSDAIEDEAFDPDDYDVYITGSMADWAEPGSDENYRLTPHDDDDEIYTIELEIGQGEYDYKYFLVEDEATWDNGEWDGDPNRYVTVTEDMEVNDLFGNQPYEVTFNVDMSETEDFDPDTYDVYVTGTVADWTSTEWAEPGTDENMRLEVSDDDENIYTVTQWVNGGEHEYKYFLVEDEPSWGNGEWDGDPNREVEITEAVEFNDIFGNQDDGTVSSEELAEMPSNVELNQNYPNPFNPTTTIEYQIPADMHVELTVYNTLGQEVATLVDDQMNSGTHEVSFDGSSLASGVYIYRLQANGQVITNQMTLVK